MEVLVKNTNNVSFIYKEPTLNKDGSPLADLKETRAHAQVGSGPSSVVKIQPATALTGGGDVQVDAVLPVLEDQEADVQCWVTAVDLAGNISTPSNIVTVRIDRLAPANPI